MTFRINAGHNAPTHQINTTISCNFIQCRPIPFLPDHFAEKGKVSTAQRDKRKLTSNTLSQLSFDLGRAWLLNTGSGEVQTLLASCSPS